MSEAPTLWDRVDDRVLRWVTSLPPSLEGRIYELELRQPEPFTGIEGLVSRAVDESLIRLVGYGLVEGGRNDFGVSVTWSGLRVTAQGFMVLGEWPDLEQVLTAASLRLWLENLARDAPDAEQSALRRAAEAAGRFGDDVVRAIASDVGRSLGRGLGDV
jgi:hypothetical protein